MFILQIIRIRTETTDFLKKFEFICDFFEFHVAKPLPHFVDSKECPITNSKLNKN